MIVVKSPVCGVLHTHNERDLTDDHGASPNILYASEDRGVSREAPAMRGDFQCVTFMAVDPAVVNVDRRFFHQMNVHGYFMCFFIEDFEPCRIAE